MNIEEFKKTYAAFKDVDKIEIDCEHPNHQPSGQKVVIGKQPARRNILKNEGKKFICGKCISKYDNPALRTGENRQTNEIIEVFCPCAEHNGEPSRQMKKSCYYGSMEQPYLQICGSCAQKGKEISEEQREKIRLALKGIQRSDEFKEKLSFYMKNNPEGIERGRKNLLENHCTTGMLGKTHSEQWRKEHSERMSGRVYTDEHRKNISEGRKKMLDETGGFTQEHRERISKATIKQYQSGFEPKLHHLRGTHESSKIPEGKAFFRSSYEKKAFMKLDADDAVVSYEVEKITTEYYNPVKNINSSYLIDILVHYVDGTSKLIEIKPEKWLTDEVVQAKIEAGKAKAKEMGLGFEVWTEMNLFGHVYNKKTMEAFIDKISSGVI
jgi:hypothetical protein